MADRVGQQLGNYVLTQFLGKGGFAEVYLGKHVYLNTNAAIKALHVQLASSEQESFLKEARLIASLVHPNIVRVLDFGVQDGTPFLVMDYAPNGTLRQIHPRGTKLPILTVVSYTRQVAEGLQYAHNKKLIHRDIKPKNLLVGANHEILLSDFGTALVVETMHNQDLIEMSGTVTYMAPEQISGKPRAASDQYGLAVVVYEWLTGMPPFRGSFTELFTQHMFTPPTSLREALPNISEDVDQVIQTALAKDPDKRFGSVKAFANALQQACLVEQPTIAKLPPISAPLRAVPETLELPEVRLAKNEYDTATAALTEKEPVNSSTGKTSNATMVDSDSASNGEALTPVLPETSPMKTALPAQGQPASKHGISRRAVLSGLAAGVVLAGAATGSVLLFSQRTKPEVLSTPTATRAPSPTPSPTPAQSPSVTIPRNAVFIYRGHTQLVSSLAWSPDGQYLVTGSFDSSVQVWEWKGTTGSPTISYKHSQQVYTVGWSPDGQYIASAGLSSEVQVRDAAHATLVCAYNRHAHGVSSLAWSPDGQRIVSGGFDLTAQVWNASTCALITTYRNHYSEVLGVCWSPDGQYAASCGGHGNTNDSVQVWSPVTGNMLFSDYNYTQPVKAVAWSHDGMYIAAGSFDKNIHIIDATTGKIVHIFNDPSTDIRALAWSPDGTKLVTGGSKTNAVQVWDIASGKVIFNYKNHSKGIAAVAWSPDGKMIASGSYDKTAQVWFAP